jgi:mannonate dehydratase
VSGDRIERAEVIVCGPGRNFVTLKLSTTDGVVGLGDATLNGRELAVAVYLNEHVCPLLVEREADRIEDTWQYLYKGAYWRRGPVTMAAIGAVDTALWDIKAKRAGLPLYQLLGGASRSGVRLYAHAAARDVDELNEAVGRRLEEGYSAVRAQATVPGYGDLYGISEEGLPYEPAERGGRPPEHLWSTEAYLRFAPRMLESVREQHGFEFSLLHDAHHRLTPIEAARLGKDVEPSRLFWLEDPVPAELQEGFRQIREHTTTPIAVGEVFNSLWDCELLIREGLIDYLRCAVTHAGGISHLRKIAALAEVHHVRIGCHGPTDLSPITMAASAHFNLAVHNFGLHEYVPHSSETDAVFPHAYTIADGMLHPGDEPGHGASLDEDAAERFPYEPAYLPVNRLEDGTLHSW